MRVQFFDDRTYSTKFFSGYAHICEPDDITISSDLLSIGRGNSVLYNEKTELFCLAVCDTWGGATALAFIHKSHIPEAEELIAKWKK